MLALYVAKIVEVDWLELIIKDLDNCFLRETCKTEDETLDFLKNLIYNVVFFV